MRSGLLASLVLDLSCPPLVFLCPPIITPRDSLQVLKLVNQLRFRCMLVVLNTRTRKLLVLLAVSYLVRNSLL